jgi:hypothetical protein
MLLIGAKTGMIKSYNRHHKTSKTEVGKGNAPLAERRKNNDERERELIGWSQESENEWRERRKRSGQKWRERMWTELKRQRNQRGSGPSIRRATITVVREWVQDSNGGEGDNRSNAVHNNTVENIHSKHIFYLIDPF